MSDPITWRNVTGPSNADVALAGFRSAGQSIGGAFDAFSNILKQREATDAANVGVQNETQKQNFLDILSGAKTPEQLAALQASGQIEQARAGLTSANRAATRDAEESRLASLRQQTTTANSYNDQILDRQQAPIKDGILTLANEGKHTEALAALAANPGLRNAAELAKAIQTSQRDGTRFQWQENAETRANAADGRSAESHRMSMDNSQLSLKSGEIDLAQKQQKQADDLAVRNLTDRLSEESAKYQSNMVTSRKAIGVEAAALGLPVDKDGLPALTRYEKKDKDRLDKVLKEKGLPALTTIERGDTTAASDFKAKMLAAGTRPEVVAAVEAKLPAAFSTAPMAEIGIDASNTARKSAQEDAKAEEERARLGVVATPGTIDGLRKSADAQIDKLAGGAAWRAESYRRQLGDFLAEGGIPVKDSVTGKTTRVLPSEEMLGIILNRVSTSNGLGPLSMYGDDISKTLKAWANSAEAKESAAAAIENDSTRRDRAVIKAALKK